MKKTVLAICALIPVIAHGADHQTTPYMFRFSDTPGTYKIKVESVNDVKGPKDNRTYKPLSSCTNDYVQQNDNNNDNNFVNNYHLHENATHVRISIRKLENGKFKRGGCAFLSAPELRMKARELQDKKRYNAGITIENQFENFAKGQYLPKIGSDTPYAP